MSAILEKIEEHEKFELGTYLTSKGCALLFPFIRETIANLTARGRFGPVWLNPVNVVALMASDSTISLKGIQFSE